MLCTDIENAKYFVQSLIYDRVVVLTKGVTSFLKQKKSLNLNKLGANVMVKSLVSLCFDPVIAFDVLFFSSSSCFDKFSVVKKQFGATFYNTI